MFSSTVSVEQFTGMRKLRVAVFPIITLLLTACGGSGGGGDTQNETTPTFTVTSTAGNGGSISPSQTVNQGDMASFAITPNIGYVIDAVSGCGGTLSGNTYTTAAITADCTVTANFSIISYTVGTSAGANGAISPADASVDHGNTTSFTITPDTNYVIDSVSGCGGSLVGDTYTTDAVTADCTITASFRIISYTVSTNAGANGAISPDNTTVDHGSTASFTITPAAGYLIDSVSGCGGSLTDNTYTTDAVTAECTVSATFIARTLAAVAPLFDNAVNWNDYVQGSDWTTAASSSGACGLNDIACLHGGEYRVVEATDKTSCVGLTVTDALGAFNWTCDSSTDPVRFVSTGLADGKYLSDLIDFTGSGSIRANAVTVYENNILWATTPSSVWWSNAVEINNSGGDLAAASTIYLVTSDPAAVYTLSADKAALVVQPGVSLAGSGLYYAVLVSAVDINTNFLWFEGNVDGSGLSVNYTYFSQLRGVTVNDPPAVGIDILAQRSSFTDMVVNNSSSVDRGIYLNNASNNTLTNVISNNNTGVGIQLDAGANNNTLTNVIANNNARSGINLTGASSNNRLLNVVARNNTRSGMWLNTASDNTISNTIASNNGLVGIYLSNAPRNVLTGIAAFNNYQGINNYGTESNNNSFDTVSVSNNADTGLYLEGSSNNSVTGITASNNGNYGIRSSGMNNRILAATSVNNSQAGFAFDNGGHYSHLFSTSVAMNNSGSGFIVRNDNTMSDIASVSNNGIGILLQGANSAFTGLLEVGNNSTDCANFVAPTIAGLDDNCGNTGNSTATLSTAIDLSSSFVGKASSDSHNTSHTNGTAEFSLIDPTTFDWSSFENDYRAWGIDGSAGFPNADQRGRWTTGTGRIYDWSLSTGDIGNNGSPALLGVIPVPTGDDFITHAWDVSAAATAPSNDTECAAIVAGSTWNGADCESNYLRGAIEITADGIGNDNGLCESGETCLYTPNIGAYQGHGNLISAGDFVDGTITGITLLKYETNGVTQLGGPGGGGQVIEI